MKLFITWLGYIGCLFGIALNATRFVFKAIEHGRLIENREALEMAIFTESLVFGGALVIFIIAVINIHAYFKGSK